MRYPSPPTPSNPDPTLYAKHATLRDYFAAKAMQAFVSAWVATKQYPNTDLQVAEHAYAMADAMLEARET